MLVSIQHQIGPCTFQRGPRGQHLFAVLAMQAGGEHRVMPHRQNATAVALDLLQLLLEPGLLLIDERRGNVAVETDYPPITHLHAEPGFPAIALAEVQQKNHQRTNNKDEKTKNNKRENKKCAPGWLITGSKCFKICVGVRS